MMGVVTLTFYSHCTVHFNVKYKKRYLCATFIFDVSQTYGAIICMITFLCDVGIYILIIYLFTQSI